MRVARSEVVSGVHRRRARTRADQGWLVSAAGQVAQAEAKVWAAQTETELRMIQSGYGKQMPPCAACRQRAAQEGSRFCEWCARVLSRAPDSLKRKVMRFYPVNDEQRLAEMLRLFVALLPGNDELARTFGPRTRMVSYVLEQAARGLLCAADYISTMEPGDDGKVDVADAD